MLKKPTLSLIAQAGIKELKERWGVEPDLAEMIWLHELGLLVENPPGVVPLDVLDLPVSVGNVTLWGFTIGASLWWRECALNWFDGDESIAEQTLAFTLAHSREPEKIRELTDRHATTRAVKKWANGIGCTDRELNWPIDKILSDDEEAEENDDDIAADWGGLVASLCKQYGGTPEYWTWEASQDVALGMISKAVDMDAASQGDISDAYKKANANFREAISQIRIAHNGS